MKKHIEKTIHLYSQSRLNNLRFEGLLKDDNETWDEMEAIVKNFLVEKLDFESAPEIERAHRTGRTGRQDGTPKLNSNKPKHKVNLLTSPSSNSAKSETERMVQLMA